MDEINEFFNFSKKFERVTVPSGILGGQGIGSSEGIVVNHIVKREEKGKEYIKEHVDAEMLRLREEENVGTSGNDMPAPMESGISEMDMLDELETISDDGEPKPKINKADENIFDKYQFNMQCDDGLPIHDSRVEIMEAIRKKRVIILEGDTGCGKTTQVPQYVLEDAFKRRERVNIVCTQPRRIAAMSICKRVNAERKWEEGSLVGYQVALHANVSEDTRLLYCTTGVLLQRIISDKNLNKFTHIFLDEVHERDQEMDFLLIVIRRLMVTVSKHVKVILMSATFDATEFAEYFSLGGSPAPVIKVDKRRVFTVKEYYLCELSKINHKAEVDFYKPDISEEMYILTQKLILIIENIESHESAKDPNKKTSILIFLPGYYEIDRMFDKLMSLEALKSLKLMPIRLHSMVAPQEQQKVFIRAPPGYRKVILATNIAESSITVPDVKYVIDFCLTKVLTTDCTTNYSSLQLKWASKSNCRQRSGRAGRVMNGRVYRMVPRDFFENCLEDYILPDMLRKPLDTVVLRAKLLDMGPPPVILALAMTPPNLSDVHSTILNLKECGAMFKTVNGQYSIDDGDITFLGRVMSALPLDVRFTRLIIMGYLFSVLEEAIIIAAGLSVQTIFTVFDRNRGELAAYCQKLAWADASGSDLFAILEAYRVWCTMHEQHNLRENGGEISWAERYFVNIRSLKEMHLLVAELKSRLLSFGIKETTAYQRVHWLDREKTIILKVVIAGAFYPNFFVRSNLNNNDIQRAVHTSIYERDPCSTVFFNNFNTRHIGQIYKKSIKKLFENARIPPDNINVEFIEGSEKVLVNFKDSSEDQFGSENSKRVCVPGQVRLEVYKAVKMRQLKFPTTIQVMDVRSGINYAEEKRLGTMFEGTWKPAKQRIRNSELIVIPNVFTRYVRGYITHIDSCSKFYFQPLSEMERLREIHSLINCPEAMARKFRNASEISTGMILAAPFEDKYYRAQVIQLIYSSRQHLEFQVFFIDFGNQAVVNFTRLRRLYGQAENLVDIPPRAMECRLAMVQPSSVVSPNNQWSDEAGEYLQNLSDEIGTVELEVYSVENKMVSVYVKTGQTTVNDVLIEKGLAQKSDENYRSKMDHDLRSRKQSLLDRFSEEQMIKQNEEYLMTVHPEYDLETDPPPERLCLNRINLRGPFSPLETKIFSATRIGSWKTVVVERDSVNSVLLDTDPQDLHERLMVAASVSETRDRNSLMIRQTTLMPNIHGFGALMTLLFCPTVQMHRDSAKSKYVSILAGLGHDENHNAIFEEHDIVQYLDAELTTDDLVQINQIRYSMDSILFTDVSDERPSIQPKLRADLSAKIKNVLIKLLSKPRQYIETHFDSRDHLWQPPDPKDHICTAQIYGHRSIFPLHDTLRLYAEIFDQIHYLQTHCKELYLLRHADNFGSGMKCELCNHNLENIAQLRVHLLSKLHRDREHQINFQM